MDMPRLFVLLIVSIAFAPVGSFAAATQPQSPPRSEQSTAPAANSRDVIQKQEVKSYTLSPEKYEKAVAYSRTQYRLHFFGIGYSVVALMLILAFRIPPLFREWAERISRRRIVQVFVFVPLLLFVFDAMKFPLSAYHHYLAVRYELSVQGWSSWLWDWTKGEIIKFIVASILTYILYIVIRRSPRLWWLYFGLLSLPIIVFLQFIAPVVVDPLFNKFEPLEATQPKLVAEIEKLMNHGGLDIPRERMFEMNASEKETAVDAYVTGFGASKRVVVYDTTIEKMTEPQTLFVVGHEMGHYVLRHIVKGIAFSVALIIVLLFIIYLSIKRLLSSRQRRWAIKGLDDWASLPVLMLLFYVCFFLSEPAFNSFSRYQEHQADVYGLEVTHGILPDSSETAAEAFQILGEVDLADPDPSSFIKIWLYTHPALADRLEFARQYDPWSKGQQPMFVR
jgi:Zn-dependent protease with chaperone function